jgi:hypothetical protein
MKRFYLKLTWSFYKDEKELEAWNLDYDKIQV